MSTNTRSELAAFGWIAGPFGLILCGIAFSSFAMLMVNFQETWPVMIGAVVALSLLSVLSGGFITAYVIEFSGSMVGIVSSLSYSIVMVAIGLVLIGQHNILPGAIVALCMLLGSIAPLFRSNPRESRGSVNKTHTFGSLCITIGGIMSLASMVLLITTWNELWFIPLIGFACGMFGGGLLVISQRQRRS